MYIMWLVLFFWFMSYNDYFMKHPSFSTKTLASRQSSETPTVKVALSTSCDVYLHECVASLGVFENITLTISVKENVPLLKNFSLETKRMSNFCSLEFPVVVLSTLFVVHTRLSIHVLSTGWYLERGKTVVAFKEQHWPEYLNVA